MSSPYDGQVRSSSATTGRWSEAVVATARAARIPTAAQSGRTVSGCGDGNAWPGRTPLRWPVSGRPALYVTALNDPAVLPHLLHA
ncbi:hypothetical protein [Amycolatopsis thermoflava]|uniref:Uncharacterized protein n=1 Tax=Amycolatopsis thermoflava TaxID=84480 RepID=A0A3N2GQS3_9PSEU|nr:hypothetical protein [Amycolatopsis thermoflava]ROS38967.1 hypothetical protein EDD35_1259 [Amycolatopsis thermoflava]